MAKLGQFKPGATADSIRQRAYNSRPEQKKRRAQRNGARRAAERIHGKASLRGKEVDHVGASTKGGLNNAKTRIISRKLNRSLGGKKSK
mgnify:FL=1